jgi:hypothetical protein
LWYTTPKGRAPASAAGAGKYEGDKGMNGRKRSRNEKIFYVISLVIVLSMLFSMIAVAITPQGL